MIRIQCHLAERNYKRYDISSPGLQSLKQSTGKLQWSQRFPKDGAGQAELTHEAGPDQQQPHLSETTTRLDTCSEGSQKEGSGGESCSSYLASLEEQAQQREEGETQVLYTYACPDTCPPHCPFPRSPLGEAKADV